MGLSTKRAPRPSGWLLSLLLSLLPLLGWCQTTIVNYDFGASGAPFATAVASPTLASGVTATATATGTTPVTVAGVATGPGAFAANATAGGSITIDPFSAGDYLQFQLGGGSLGTYANYKVYFQAQRSANGPTDITLAYSTDGNTYTTFSPTSAVGTAFGSAEYIFDLSAVAALNNKSSVSFRVVPSGGSTGGTVRIDNFQVQASTAPTLIVTPGTLSGFTTTTASPSTSQPLTVSASNLSPGSGTLTANSSSALAYEFSRDNTNFTGPLTGLGVAYTSATPAPIIIYARLKTGLAAGAYNNQTVTISGGEASTTLTLNGTVTGTLAAPLTVTTSGTTATTTTATVSGGNGAKRLLVIRLNSVPAVAPTNGTTYTASGVFGSGSTTGAGNFVVIAGTAGSQLITGLAPSTVYAADVYAYNDNGSSGSEAYLVPGTSIFFNTLAGSATPTTYTWNGSAGASFNAPANWSPTRTTPAPTDVLIFNGATTATASVTLDFASPQTISQLLLRNSVRATFTTSADRTLTLDGNATGDDFVLDATSRLTLTTTTNSAGLTIALAAPQTGLISGTLVFDGSAGNNGKHALTALAPNSVQFVTGSIFRSTTFYDGSSAVKPLGSALANANSIVFRDGSRYEQFGGSNPFALDQPASVVTFEPRSRFVFSQNTFPSLSGRIYGILEYNNTAAATDGVGSSPLIILGDLIVTSGNPGLNLTGGIFIAGNVEVNTPGTLNFTPASAGTVTFNGTTPQLIFGTNQTTDAIKFEKNATLRIDNEAGITLDSPLSVAGNLSLVRGRLTTDEVNIPTMLPGATITAGTIAVTASGPTALSFVNGPLEWQVDDIATPTSFFFPTGIRNAAGESNYRPLTLNITRQSGTTYYRNLQQERDPGGNLATTLPVDNPSGKVLSRISRVRYYNLTPYARPRAESIGQPQGFSGTVRLTFDVNDKANDPASPDLVVAKRADQNAPWFNFGRSASSMAGPGVGPGVNGYIVSGAFTLFSDFSLATTNPDIIRNPLPVQLVSFGATRTGGGVQLRWATATETNNAYFEVERSADGRGFTKLTQVAGQGSKPTRTDYAWLDAAAPATALYYRLRQVDQDGTATYSPVATVAGRAGEAAPVEFTLSPNPAQTTVSFGTGQPTAYVLRSVLGQALRTGITTPGLNTLDVAGLAAGVYLVELRTDTGRLVRRFVKE